MSVNRRLPQGSVPLREEHANCCGGGQMKPTGRGTYREILQNLTGIRVLKDFSLSLSLPLLGPR